jgi:hypothetical protein
MPGRCAYRHCDHAEHRGRCKGKASSRCLPLVDYDTGEAIIGFACGYRQQCPCPWEACPCGALVAVAEAIPGGAETPVERGSAGGGDLEVWYAPDGGLLCAPLPAAGPGEGRYRGRAHEAACGKPGHWQGIRDKAAAELARYMKGAARKGKAAS